MIRGFTILELSVTLVIAGVLLSVSVRTGAQMRDRFLVLGAREEVIGLVARARSVALRQGGATLTLSEGDRSAFIISKRGGDLEAEVDLGRRFGVELNLGRPTASLQFGSLGLGRVASRTIRIRRGRVEEKVVVSSFGRVRRR